MVNRVCIITTHIISGITAIQIPAAIQNTIPACTVWPLTTDWGWYTLLNKIEAPTDATDCRAEVIVKIAPIL